MTVRFVIYSFALVLSAMLSVLCVAVIVAGDYRSAMQFLGLASLSALAAGTLDALGQVER